MYKKKIFLMGGGVVFLGTLLLPLSACAHPSNYHKSVWVTSSERELTANKLNPGERTKNKLNPGEPTEANFNPSEANFSTPVPSFIPLQPFDLQLTLQNEPMSFWQQFYKYLPLKYPHVQADYAAAHAPKWTAYPFGWFTDQNDKVKIHNREVTLHLHTLNTTPSADNSTVYVDIQVTTPYTKPFTVRHIPNTGWMKNVVLNSEDVDQYVTANYYPTHGYIIHIKEGVTELAYNTFHDNKYKGIWVWLYILPTTLRKVDKWPTNDVMGRLRFRDTGPKVLLFGKSQLTMADDCFSTVHIDDVDTSGFPGDTIYQDNAYLHAYLRMYLSRAFWSTN